MWGGSILSYNKNESIVFIANDMLYKKILKRMVIAQIFAGVASIFDEIGSDQFGDFHSSRCSQLFVVFALGRFGRLVC